MDLTLPDGTTLEEAIHQARQRNQSRQEAGADQAALDAAARAGFANGLFEDTEDDIPAILEHTRRVVFLESGQMATITRSGAAYETVDGSKLEIRPQTIAWDPVAAEKGEYRHFMEKEIHEQVRALTDTLAGRVDFDNGRIRLPQLNLDEELAKRGLKRDQLVHHVFSDSYYL